MRGPKTRTHTGLAPRPQESLVNAIVAEDLPLADYPVPSASTGQALQALSLFVPESALGPSSFYKRTVVLPH